ncbi:MAG: hypothetical protein ACI9MJ_000557 [Alphaproteobacteria bacterium]|jgi:hypothetical protein
MMKKFELNFSYKGTRQYIQGPDMFNQCIVALNENNQPHIEDVEFTIHKMTGANLSLRLFPRDEAPEKDKQDIAILKFGSGGDLWQATLVNADSNPANRQPYDEAPVVDQCDIDEEARAIWFKGHQAPYSDIETLVSMNKALHQRLFPDLPGQWVFVGWQSRCWPLQTKFEDTGIRLIKALGTRLTEAEVCRGDETLGSIYFSARTDQ